MWKEIWEAFYSIFKAFVEWLLTMEVTKEEIADYLPFKTMDDVKVCLSELFGLTCCPDGCPQLDEQGRVLEEFFTNVQDMGTKNQYGYYGVPGTTLIDGVREVVCFTTMTECIVITDWYPNGKKKSGYTKFRLDFDPNNGWIQLFQVHPDFVKSEWADKLVPRRRPNSQNPNYEEYLKILEY